MVRTGVYRGEYRRVTVVCTRRVYTAVAVTPVHVHVRVHVTAGASTRARGHEEARMGRCRPVVALCGLRGGNGSCQCPDVGSSVRSTGRRGGTETQLVLRLKLHAAHARAIRFDVKRRHQGTIRRLPNSVN